MAKEEEREVEVVIRFKNTEGDYTYDIDMDRHIMESARVLADTLKKYGYTFRDRKRLDQDDQNKMRRNFIVILRGKQTEDELRRRLDGISGARAWTYCEVF